MSAAGVASLGISLASTVALTRAVWLVSSSLVVNPTRPWQHEPPCVVPYLPHPSLLSQLDERACDVETSPRGRNKQGRFVVENSSTQAPLVV